MFNSRARYQYASKSTGVKNRGYLKIMDDLWDEETLLPKYREITFLQENPYHDYYRKEEVS